MRKASLPENGGGHVFSFPHCHTEPSLSNLNGFGGKESSESPDFDDTCCAAFNGTELRVLDDFQQEEELLSGPFVNMSNGACVFGAEGTVGYIPVTDAMTDIISENMMVTSLPSASVSACSVKESSGSRSDDSALPSSADNSDGSNAMALDVVINDKSGACNADIVDFSDSGGVLPENSDESLLSTLQAPTTCTDNVFNTGVTIRSVDTEIVDPVPPDLPPRTYKAPPLPPRNRTSNEAPPLPPRISDKHTGIAQEGAVAAVATPTSPSRTLESSNLLVGGSLLSEPPPLPPRTYSPIHMRSSDHVDRGTESGSGGSVSLLSTEDSDSKSFDSMEAHAGSRENLTNDSSGVDKRLSGSSLGPDVMKREHKKLHRVSKDTPTDTRSLSSRPVPLVDLGFGSTGLSDHRTIVPPNREWRRSAEIVSSDRGELSSIPPPIVQRHRPLEGTLSDRGRAPDHTFSERNRSLSFDSPIDRLSSLNFSPSFDSTGRDTPPLVDRVRSGGEEEIPTQPLRTDSPPPVDRSRLPASAPSTVSFDRQRPTDTPSERHKSLHLSHSVGRHRDLPSFRSDRSRNLESQSHLDRQHSVDSVPLDRLGSSDSSTWHSELEMPPSLPQVFNLSAPDTLPLDTTVTSGRSEMLTNSEGQNIYSPVLELQPPICSRQRSKDSARNLERQFSSESQLSSSSSSSFQSQLSAPGQNLKTPARRSISPALRRVIDPPPSDRVLPTQGAVGGSPPVPQKHFSYQTSISTPPRPETPPRPAVLGAGRDTPSPPVIHPRGRILSEEEKQQNRRDIQQHLQMWKQKRQERADTSFGSDTTELELASPSSETRSMTNGHCGWISFDDPPLLSSEAMSTSQTHDLSLNQSDLTEIVTGAEGGVLLGQSAIEGDHHSLTPANSLVWQLRHTENDPAPSIDSGRRILHRLVNPLPDDKILDWSKLKQIADDILKCI